MKKVVFGLVKSQDHANRIVERLLASGFTNSDISVLTPDRHARNPDALAHATHPHSHETHASKGTLATEKHSKAPEGAATGATAGGILGGSLGLLAGIGSLAIPGVGPFIAAGPIMAALSGSAIGGSLGLAVGSLIGLGIPEYEAVKYKSGLESGGTLLSVHVTTSDQLKKAEDILKNEKAEDISSTSEK